MVIDKKNTSQKMDKDWFMFSTGLSRHLFSDYVSLKLAFQMEPLAFAQTNLVKMAEVVEKAFKLFLAVHEKKKTLCHITVMNTGIIWKNFDPKHPNSKLYLTMKI